MAQEKEYGYNSALICNTLHTCPGGEIGRRRGLKIPRRKACRFDSGPGHQLKIPSVYKVLARFIATTPILGDFPKLRVRYSFGTLVKRRVHFLELSLVWQPSSKPLLEPGKPSFARQAGLLHLKHSEPNETLTTGRAVPRMKWYAGCLSSGHRLSG